MGGIEQGVLKLSGVPCEGPPFCLWISQGFNRHGRMKIGVWASEEAGKGMHTDMPVTLELTGKETTPVFCGVIKKCTVGKEKSQRCLYLEVETGSSLLDREKKTRSFQRRGRSFEELIGETVSPYHGYLIWKKGAGGAGDCGFLLQYEETDWEFIRRAASMTGNGILPECRFSGNGFYIGLPDSQGETELESPCYSERRHIPGSVLEDGTVCTGSEYVAKDCGLMLYPGDRVRFRGQYLAVAEKESRLEGGILKNTYTLRREDAFRTAQVCNYSLIGASIAGTVVESGPEKSRLALSTDGAGEEADSWHSRPVFYSGGGTGYSGRPEPGDTLYLYFPTEHEESRSIIGGGGAGYESLHAVTQEIMDDTAAEEEEAEKNQPLFLGEEDRKTSETEVAVLRSSAGKTKKADAFNMTDYKNWSTPGKQGVSLNPGGIRFRTGKGTSIGMGSGGVILTGRGDAELKGKNDIEIDMICGKQVVLKAEEYIYIQCGASATALLPEEIHLKGPRIQLDSPLNEKDETVFSDSAVETLKKMYYNEKWGSPLQLFMPDGTAIGRVKGLEQNAALRKYFEENVLNTEGYVNYLDTPVLDEYYEDGMLDPSLKKERENGLYLQWLSATYGKTGMQKLGDWLVTKEGRHAALDGIGIFLEPADAANAVLYLTEKDWGNAALSGISMAPVLGDCFGKGGKGTKYLLRAVDLTKLNRNKKVIKMLENLDIFIKARKADLGEIQKWIRKSWDNLADGGGYVVEYVSPDGLIHQIRTSDDFRLHMNLMDEAGDTLQDTLQAGRRAGDGSELTEDVIKGGREALNDLDNLLDDTGKFMDDLLENNYQKYVKRNTAAGKPVRDRLDWKKASDYWTKESPLARGNNFNQTVKDLDLYPYHEVHLANGKQLDSYDPVAGEIISRKATDLDKISEETFRGYLSEIKRKYSVGTTIRSDKYPALDGMKLRGDYILEIPASNANISNIKYYEDIAKEYGVKLRFTEEIQ